MTTKPSTTERVAGWSARHRIIAVVGWLLLVAAALTLGQHLGQGNAQEYDSGQAGQAERVLNRPVVQQPPAESVLIQARSPGQSYTADLEMRQAVGQVVAALQRLPRTATDIQSPLTSPALASGRSALVTFNVIVPGANGGDGGVSEVAPALKAVAAISARHPDLTIEEGGDASLQRALGNVTSQDFRQAEVTSIPVTLVLLLLVFGALVAAGIPLLLAGTAVISAISLLAVPGRWLPIDSTTSSIVLLVGMAVGIDYSLFYLRRVREERTAGRSTREALQVAARTSGRAILVSGLTVMISLAGLFLTGIDLFTGWAIGTIMVVGIAMLGSLTFLPGLLSLLGKGTDCARIPFLGRRQAVARESRVWRALVTRVVRRPLAWGGVTVVVLLALASPLLSLHLEEPGIHDVPTSVPVIRTMLDIETAFPGGPEPAQVVVTGADLEGQQVIAAVAALHRQVAATGGAIREPITTQVFGPAGPDQVLVISVPLAGTGTDGASYSALGTLRNRALPATLGKVPGISYAVGGLTASNHDTDAQLAKTAPYVFLFVLVMAFLLLAGAFRSVWIPALSIVLNVLSVAASFGVMTWIFQGGHLSGPLDFTPYGGIVPWLPLFMFVLIFGLSMDYHVFILSRVRELRDGGASAAESVTRGIASSAGVVTSAAAIMVAVFSIFATLAIIEFKLFGVTMAAAVLLDATVVRGVLLPAGLALLGDRAWRRPGRHGPAAISGSRTGTVTPGHAAQLTRDRQR
ncbi:MAG TPA: MMPL family transporter [Trebonia sp.]|nr:MMPL family transporter [Trebonia sp.]